mgnify:CR=1 FL=1
MSIVYNLGSLVLGLAAWGIPLCAIGRKYRFGICCIGSLSCCVLSFLLQLLEVRNRVRLSDWSALMDTIDAVVAAAVIMVVVTLISNVFALWRAHKC